MTVRRARTADLDALFALRIEALETDPDAFLRTADEDRARGAPGADDRDRPGRQGHWTGKGHGEPRAHPPIDRLRATSTRSRR